MIATCQNFPDVSQLPLIKRKMPVIGYTCQHYYEADTSETFFQNSFYQRELL